MTPGGGRRTYEWADPAPTAAAARELDGISFFREGQMLCEGTVEHLGSRTALATARRTDSGGKLYAQATSSCMIFRPGG